MSSGVSVHCDCATEYNNLKLGHQYKYIIYALTPDLKQIVVLKKAAKTATYDEFVEDLKEAEEAAECRYAVYDAEFTRSDGQSRSKLVFFLWSPEGAKTKQKMVYTSSKDYLKRALVGIGKEVQACDHDDLAWSNVLEICQRNEVK